MKKTILIILLMLVTVLIYGEFEKTNLGINALAVDLVSDNNDTVHIIWLQTDGIHYGYLIGTEIIGDELIPGSSSIQQKFSRPRMGVKPDGSRVHVTWSNKSTNTVSVASREDGKWETDIVWADNSGRVAGFASNVGEDMDGTVHLIFQRFDKLPVDISKIAYYYKRDNKWSDRKTLFVGSSKYRDTNMFTDIEGGIHVRWGKFAAPSEAKYRYAPSGSLLSNSTSIPINPSSDIANVSMGDLFVDKEMNVHHAFIGYRVGAIYYVKKNKNSNVFQGYTKPSNGKIPICNPHHMDNPWPAIAVDISGAPYVSWVEMPCPSQEPNVVKVSKLVNGKWYVTVLDNVAKLSRESKPAMTASKTAVYVAWRTLSGDIMLAVEGVPGGGAIQFVSPTNNSLVCANTEIDLKGIDGNDPITSIDLFVDDNSTALNSVANQETLQYTWDTDSLTAGEHILKAVVTRESGREDEGEITVNKDCPPVAFVQAPLNNSVVSDDEIKIIINASDDKDGLNVNFYIDGNKMFTDNSSPYEYNWNTTGLSDSKKYEIKAQAVDSSLQINEDVISVNFVRIYAPTNISGEQKINRSVFHVEYTNRLKWSQNQKNSNVIKYQISLINEDNEVQNIGEVNFVDGSQFEFNHRSIDPAKTYTYLIAAIANRNGTEITGAAAEITIN